MEIIFNNKKIYGFFRAWVDFKKNEKVLVIFLQQLPTFFGIADVSDIRLKPEK